VQKPNGVLLLEQAAQAIATKAPATGREIIAPCVCRRRIAPPEESADKSSHQVAGSDVPRADDRLGVES